MGRSFAGVCQEAHPVCLAPGRNPHLTTIYDVFIPLSHGRCLDIYFKTQEIKGYSCEGEVYQSSYDWQGHSLALRQKTIWFSLLLLCPITLPGHKAKQSRKLLEGKPGKQDYFSHLPLGGVFIQVDESRKLPK